MANRSGFQYAALPWEKVYTKASSATDLPIVFAGFAMFYALLALAHYWTRPATPQVHIDLSPAALPMYALFSISRIAAAYCLSLIFALVYGYIAANNATEPCSMRPGLFRCSAVGVNWRHRRS